MIERAVFIVAAITALAPGEALVEEANAPRAVETAGQMQALVEADWIDADRRFSVAKAPRGQPVKVNAQGVTTVQDAAGAVDGIKNGRFGFHVAVGETDPWWQVDLGRDYQLDRVLIFNRTDGGHAPRTRNLGIQIARSEQSDRFESVYQHDGTVFYGANENKPLVVRFDGKDVTARIVRLHVSGLCHFALDEVEVYATSDPQKNVALGKPADQKSVSRHSYPGTIGEPTPTWVPTGGGFRVVHTRDVVRRAHELAARLSPKANPQRLDPLIADLGKLDRRLADLEAHPAVPDQVRKGVYFEARRLLRGIAFANPLLDFQKL